MYIMLCISVEVLWAFPKHSKYEVVSKPLDPTQIVVQNCMVIVCPDPLTQPWLCHFQIATSKIAIEQKSVI